MPKIPIDYSKGLIYTIIHVNDTSINYVGSTTSFVDRKRSHKKDCKSSQIKLYVMIRDNGGWDMFKMMPYKELSCQSSTELRIEEERCRLELNATLNTIRCYTTKEQKIEQKIEQNKEHYEKNKVEINEKQKEHYEKNKVEIREQQKDYYEKNKVELKEQQKEHYEKNKVEINEKHTCNCGGKYTTIHKLRHEKTQKHLNFINVPK